ncbi:MAG: zinc transporter ZupT [Lachnospiraceae bacterium]|nr:zinc transporter ZupT [Lachnospiraceae bacterium]
MSQIMFPFILTLFAGLSTGVGSLIAFVAKKTNKRFLSLSLGFSAGVMIYVSLIEIFVKAKDSLVAELGEKGGSWATVAAFFGGIFLIAIIDKVIPSEENPHEAKQVVADCKRTKGEKCENCAAKENCEEKEECVKADEDTPQKSKLMRMGVFTALAIAVHNFPEGLATFVSALQDPSIAIPIVAAIAIHNVPEGIAVSVPIYQATGSRKKAFFYSFISGLAEPVGAIIGWLLLMPVMNDVVFGVIFAGVAGIMVFISVDELLPAAREYGEHHISIYGLIAGMMVMAVSLLLFM